MSRLKHIVRFERGYDCIRFECINGVASCKPGAGGSHGRHGMSIRFVAQGAAGAVQFVISTGWLPQATEPDNIRYRDVRDWGDDMMPTDLGYHSKEPRYAGHEPIEDSCEFAGGGACYYDGSGLNANDAMYALVNGGDAALWAFLDAYYESVFNDADYPTPAEYVMPARKGNA